MDKDLTEYNYMAFYYQRRQVANIIQTAQRNYYHQLLKENKNDFIKPYSVDAGSSIPQGNMTV